MASAALMKCRTKSQSPRFRSSTSMSPLMKGIKVESPPGCNSIPMSMWRCAICGDSASSKHFGVVCCNACAAFFRRTISHQRQYTCTRGKRCEISIDQSRHMCKFCRFQRCIEMGMNMSAVFVRSPEEFRAIPMDSPIRRIVFAQRGTFVSRYASHLRACDGDRSRVRMGRENPTFCNVQTISSEFPVLLEYLRDSGIEEFGLSKSNVVSLAKDLFYPWLCFHSLVATIRNGGHRTNVAYFVDESAVAVTEQSIEEHVRTRDGLRDYGTAAKLTFDCCSEALRIAAKLQRTRMDEVELAVLFHLCALCAAIHQFPDQIELRYALNDLFEQLKHHYERAFSDVALRIGNMVLMLGELQSFAQYLTEYVTGLNLIGYNTIMARLRGADELWLC